MTDIINKEKILEHAKVLVNEGKFDRAIIEYQKLLDLDPDDLRVKIKIAELYVKRKQIQDAIRLYTEVARSYSGGGFYLKAVTVYKSILRLNPSLIDVNIALSELYERMGLVQDALYQYQIVATSLEQKGDTTGMLAIREKMSELDPKDTSLRIRLAETYQLEGNIDKSIDVYEELAKQLKKSGKADQLVEIYNKILGHRPERHELIRELCHMYNKRGEWKEVLKRMEMAKSFVSEDPELLRMQAEIYARLNQIETAKRTYRELAEVLNEQGNLEGALAAYEDVLFLGPEDEVDIAEEVEALSAGAFPKVKEHVEERRKRLTDEELKRVEEAAKPEGASKEKEEISVTSAEARGLEKEAAASYELGVMYRKIGLSEDANAEFVKALRDYKRIVSSGSLSGKLIDRMRELEDMLSKPEGNAKVEVPPPVKKTEPKKSKPAKQAKPKVEEKKEPPKLGSSKKISFV